MKLTEAQFDNMVDIENVLPAQYRITPVSREWIFLVEDGLTLHKLYNKITKTTQYNLNKAA